jgi:RNA polymerase sigma-70 factor (ECF subfamily)
VVLAAGHADGTTGQAALADICRAYWQPLYAVARRLGCAPADAEDLTQGFFAELLERPILERADAARGHFRSYLLGAFKNHLLKERQHDRAQKRGGGQSPLSLEVGELESRLATELATQRTPDAIYERAWAVALIDEAMHRLEDECRHAGRGELFQKLQPCLERDCEAGHYADIAQSLGTTEGTVQVMVCRMRRRYLELLRSVVLPTVGHPDEVEDELRHLRQVLSE